MLIEVLRKELMQSMKDKNQAKKEVLQMVISGLVNKEKEKQGSLTPAEENEVILREIKQINEFIEMVPESRKEMADVGYAKIEILKGYLPAQMTEAEIVAGIASVLDSLGIAGKCTPADKGKVMKALMPLVKGKADGQLVNALVQKALG